LCFFVFELRLPLFQKYHDDVRHKIFYSSKPMCALNHFTDNSWASAILARVIRVAITLLALAAFLYPSIAAKLSQRGRYPFLVSTSPQ